MVTLYTVLLGKRCGESYRLSCCLFGINSPVSLIEDVYCKEYGARNGDSVLFPQLHVLK